MKNVRHDSGGGELRWATSSIMVQCRHDNATATQRAAAACLAFQIAGASKGCQPVGVARQLLPGARPFPLAPLLTLLLLLLLLLLLPLVLLPLVLLGALLLGLAA